ncbi:hypothetical protein PENSPDRAFT_758653 [Peniophora sp. CONT]|nr:hypothetical protein PENSPDRAFT_758653 [Peniophora sp. CONT]
MDETNVYASLSDIPRPDALISAYNARMIILRGFLSGHTPNGSWLTMNEQAADIIDRTERTLQLLRLDIRAFRNSAMPLISRLPHEILAMIFEFSARDPDNTPHSPVATKELNKANSSSNYTTFGILRDRHVREDIFRTGSIGWIQLGHVCRQWRTLLLGMQAIWAQILGRLPSGDENILMRAGEHAPLDIFTTCTPFSLQDQRILDLLASRMSESPADSRVLSYAERLRRVCLVDLTAAEGNIHMPLEWLTSPSFPNLHTLEISLQYEHNVASVYLSPSILVVAPQLRVVRLQGCYIPWQSFMLERLSLNWIDHEALPAHTLFDILVQAAPTLQFLELWYVSLFNDYSTRGYPGQVILSRLRLLSFAACSGRLPAFLNVVKLPLGVHIRVNTYIEAEPDWLEADDPSVQQDRTAVQADIEAALSGGHFDSSLDGLVISQGDDIEPFNELYLHMYGGSLGPHAEMHQRRRL